MLDFSDLKSVDNNETNTELQPLSWHIKEVPQEFRSLWAAKMDASLITALNHIGQENGMQYGLPTQTLEQGLLNLFPDMICTIPNSFNNEQKYRPEYWLLSKSELDLDRLQRIVKYWILLHDNSGKASQILKLHRFQFDMLPIDLSQASPYVIEKSLPHLIANWLVENQYEYTLLSDEKETQSLQVYHCISDPRSGNAELITNAIYPKDEKIKNSYALRFKSKKNHECGWNVHLMVSVRRWAYERLYLSSKRKKSVYIPGNDGRFLLFKLAMKEKKGVWDSRLNELMQFMSVMEIPEPERIIEDPTIAYVPLDQNMKTTHIEKGTELRDRAQTFEDISAVLPNGIEKEKPWSCVWTGANIPKRKDGLTNKKPDKFSQKIRRDALEKMGLPVSVHIWTYSKEAVGYLEEYISEELGNPSADELTVFIFECPDLLGTLESDKGQKKRALQIKKAIKPNRSQNQGVIVILKNDYSKKRELADKDCYETIRQTLAGLGYVTQFLIHDDEPVDSTTYKSKSKSAIRDLFRQMEFQAGSLYYPYSKTSLPSLVDLIGLYHLNKDNKIRIPFLNVIRAADDDRKWEIFIPGKHTLSFREANLHLATFKDKMDYQLSRQFYRDKLRELLYFSPALLIVDEQNISNIFPELRRDQFVFENNHLVVKDIPFHVNERLRIAVIRNGFDLGVPWYYPMQSMRNRNNGLYQHSTFQNVFYSFQAKNDNITKGSTTKVLQIDRPKQTTWIQNAVEITLLNLEPEDVAQDWALVVHKLRQESSHTDIATKLPEPLHSMEKSKEYLSSLNVGI